MESYETGKHVPHNRKVPSSILGIATNLFSHLQINFLWIFSIFLPKDTLRTTFQTSAHLSRFISNLTPTTCTNSLFFNYWTDTLFRVLPTCATTVLLFSILAFWVFISFSSIHWFWLNRIPQSHLIHYLNTSPNIKLTQAAIFANFRFKMLMHTVSNSNWSNRVFKQKSR